MFTKFDIYPEMLFDYYYVQNSWLFILFALNLLFNSLEVLVFIFLKYVGTILMVRLACRNSFFYILSIEILRLFYRNCVWYIELLCLFQVIIEIAFGIKIFLYIFAFLL